MSNIQRLATEGNKNHKLFVDAINTLKCSQGFYGRLYNYINEMDEDNYMDLYDLLEGQDFKDTLDVVFFLEC
ncbi:MAG: hypothetical protein J6M26_06640 [Clostridia bacterium]|jgi:hypothetical protein|nr:hypothetical protein [Clostridia bacterium]